MRRPGKTRVLYCVYLYIYYYNLTSQHLAAKRANRILYTRFRICDVILYYINIQFISYKLIVIFDYYRIRSYTDPGSGSPRKACGGKAVSEHDPQSRRSRAWSD